MSTAKKKRSSRSSEEYDSKHSVQVKTEESSYQQEFNPLDAYAGHEVCFEKLEEQSIKQEAIKIEYEVRKKTRKVRYNSMKGTKIVRNYAKALCSFAYSDMALSYLDKIIKREFNGVVKVEDFQKYIKQKKGQTASILSLRGLLMEDEYDSQKERIYKKIFTQISIIFIKFFSVNWIFGGKVKYRLEHLKYRHKMLRRIKNPQYFTYLKSCEHNINEGEVNLFTK